MKAPDDNNFTGFPKTALVAGGSGLIGSAFVEALRVRGTRVRRLVRREPTHGEEVYWNPYDGTVDISAIETADALISFSGENIAAGRWTAQRRRKILESRLMATETLARALARTPCRPAIWINASAVGYYGSRGRDVLSEEAGAGTGFLASVCEQWEAAAHVSEVRDTRIVFARFGMVLSDKGGALPRMLPIFRARLGGSFGRGDQWMSWISRSDAVAALIHVLTARHCCDGVNLVAPNPVTNREFTRTLGKTLKRPARLRVPAWALRCVFGRMAEETLLASQRAVPAKLLATGFQFRHPTLESAFRELLDRDQI